MRRRGGVDDEGGEGTPNQIGGAIPEGGVHRHADYATFFGLVHALRFPITPCYSTMLITPISDRTISG